MENKKISKVITEHLKAQKLTQSDVKSGIPGKLCSLVRETKSRLASAYSE